MTKESINSSKAYRTQLTAERCRIANIALDNVKPLCMELHEIILRLNQSWKARNAKTNDLILSHSAYELLREIANLGLETEELLESLRKLMTDISKHYNIAITETAAILNDALETENNMEYIEGRKLLDRLVNVAIKFNGRKITGIRPEILVDTYAHYNVGTAAIKYSSARFLLRKLINTL